MGQCGNGEQLRLWGTRYWLLSLLWRISRGVYDGFGLIELGSWLLSLKLLLRIVLGFSLSISPSAGCSVVSLA
ncbi:unnamed protein product [Linum trigynum]|uniref:Uncharacterized protein n=1 Tax=Linum trigynum TaxID=586398 RepID=A0AAV2DGF7_9ROSI